MIGIIVISESHAAKELLTTVKKAMGRKAITGIIPLAIRSNFTKRTLTDRVNQAIRKFKNPDGIVILSEIYGSTQTNVCREFLANEYVEIVCGYNLAMLIKAASTNDSDNLKEFVRNLVSSGRKYVKAFK